MSCDAVGALFSRATQRGAFESDAEPFEVHRPNGTGGRMMRKLLVGGVVAIGVTIGLAGYLVTTTFGNTGDAAVARMSAEERRYLDERVSRVSPGMSYDDVVGVLGEPERSGAGLRPTWTPTRTPFSQVAVYFRDGRVFSVRWIKLGGFVYEKKL
jgi:hypothetical protein